MKKLKREAKLHQKFIQAYLAECEQILKKISTEDIDKIIVHLFKAWRDESSIFVIGNGGSASSASHFAADLSKYPISNSYEQKIRRFKVMCLTDSAPSISAWTNDVGFETIFEEQLKPWLKTNDVVVAFSVHGGSGSPTKGKKWSQNIPRAIALAKERGAKVIGFSGDKGGVLKELSDACLVVPTVNRDTITPQVEGFHVVIHHLIIHRLKQLIQSWGK